MEAETARNGDSAQCEPSGSFNAHFYETQFTPGLTKLGGDAERWAISASFDEDHRLHQLAAEYLGGLPKDTGAFRKSASGNAKKLQRRSHLAGFGIDSSIAEYSSARRRAAHWSRLLLSADALPSVSLRAP
jgi:hypothetical protein